ncbi:MAG: hypothetical protein MN733_30265 [Nitrososphaera sp.]|nr:hypothetical protein [Nitrososphaera sp.]
MPRKKKIRKKKKGRKMSTLLSSLKTLLVQGVKVSVAADASDVTLRGVSTTVKSKALSECKRKDCTSPADCIGQAVFVVDPSVPQGSGWRSNARKLCLTAIQDEHGQLVLPRSPKIDGSESATVQETAPATEALATWVPGQDVTWDELAKAAQRQERETITLMARQLKDENEMLMVDLTAAQDRYISALERLAAFEPEAETATVVEPAAPPVIEEDDGHLDFNAEAIDDLFSLDFESPATVNETAVINETPVAQPEAIPSEDAQG